VLFYFTVLTENNVNAIAAHPNEVVNVVAYRWGWRFTYADGSHRLQGVTIQTGGEPKALPQGYFSPLYPQMVLPLGETVEIDLTSTDVIHALYVPAMNFSRQAIPGVRNVFDFTPTTTGVFGGQCVQYCGLYHSQMLFSVRVLPAAAFRQWLIDTQATQAANGSA
jgi:cytochrome c oxidase subunit 2